VPKKEEEGRGQRRRLQLEWVSAAEGIRFAQLMEEMEKLRREVTPEEIAETVILLAERTMETG